MQACLALRGEGVDTILVNSNPATVMTDPDVGGTVLIGPLSVAYLERVIAEHRPDALLPTLGGQTGLNLAVALDDAGVLERYGVRVLGTPLAAVRAAEDRGGFRDLVTGIGEPVPESAVVEIVEDGLALRAPPRRARCGPAGIHPRRRRRRLRLRRGGGAGADRARPGGQPHQPGAGRALAAGLVRDRVRGAAGRRRHTIAICGMENLDPMGVHTGDSIVVAPIQTLPDPVSSGCAAAR